MQLTQLTGKKILALLTALVMATMMFAACGGSGGGVEGGVAGDSTAAPASGDAAAAEGSSGGGASAADADIIKIGVSGTPELDPAVANTNSGVQAMINLYDTLVFPGADGEVEPRVAESWEISDDGLTYVFKIKEGIKFHNGSELTASDVAFSMNRLITIGEGYAYLFTDCVDTAEATGDYEVTFKLKQSYGPFLSALIRLGIVCEEQVMENIVDDGTYGEFGDYGKAWLVTNDAGSGAYMYDDLVQQDYFQAVKYDDWFMGWDDKPNAPGGFKMMSIADGATVRTMMNTGDLDITDQWQSSENLAAMAEMEGVEIGKFSTFLVQNMYMNTQKAPMDDVNFRRAMHSLFDYQVICDDILVDSVQAAGPVATGVAGHIDTTTFDYNVETAADYIAQSAYADDYQDYTIEVTVLSDVADHEKIALMFQAAAAELGITVEITKTPWVAVIDQVATVESTPHMLSINSAPPINDAGPYLEERYHSRNMGTWQQCEWLDSAEIDGMIEDALATVDADERYQKYADIQNTIVDDYCPTIELCYLTERVAYHSSYISWPAIENAEDGVGRATYGYMHVFADMELFPDQR